MQDFLGHEIAEGDYVSGISPENETPHIYSVVGNTPKKLRLMPLHGIAQTTLKYPFDVVKIDAVAVNAIRVQAPKDMLGQDLAIGDTVFGSGGSYIDPVIFKIDGFLPRKAVLAKVYGEHWVTGQTTRYLTDLIKVTATPEITMHCLTKENE